MAQQVVAAPPARVTPRAARQRQAARRGCAKGTGPQRRPPQGPASSLRASRAHQRAETSKPGMGKLPDHSSTRRRMSAITGLVSMVLHTGRRQGGGRREGGHRTWVREAGRAEQTCAGASCRQQTEGPAWQARECRARRAGSCTRGQPANAYHPHLPTAPLSPQPLPHSRLPRSAPATPPAPLCSARGASLTRQPPPPSRLPFLPTHLLNSSSFLPLLRCVALHSSSTS